MIKETSRNVTLKQQTFGLLSCRRSRRLNTQPARLDLNSNRTEQAGWSVNNRQVVPCSNLGRYTILTRSPCFYAVCAIPVHYKRLQLPSTSFPIHYSLPTNQSTLWNEHSLTPPANDGTHAGLFVTLCHLMVRLRTYVFNPFGFLFLTTNHTTEYLRAHLLSRSDI